MEKINRFLLRAEIVLGSILLGLSFMIITAGIIARYLFNAPLAGAEEISIFLFVWMGFLAIAYGIGTNGHIRIDAILCRLSGRMKTGIQIVTNAILLIMFMVCIWPSVTTLAMLKVTPALRLPEKYIYSILPISFCLYCVHLTINISTLVKSFQNMGSRNRV